MRLEISVSTALILGALLGGAGAQPAPALFPITVNDKHGMIDRDGNVVIPPEYAEPVIIGIAVEGLYRVWSGRKQGFMDGAGRVVVAPQFDQAIRN